MYLFIRNRETFTNHTRYKIFISSNEESNPSHVCRETRGWTIAPRNIPEWRFLFSEAAASASGVSGMLSVGRCGGAIPDKTAAKSVSVLDSY